MVTVPASIIWDGPTIDILRVFVDLMPASGVEVIDEDVVLFRALDEDEEPTGEVTGVEIIGFLSFDRWGDIPALPLRWQLQGAEPLSLTELLMHLQQDLRQRREAGAA